MKVGLFFGTFAGGGAERMMINLAKGMHAAGIEVTIYVVNKTGVLLPDVPSYLRVHDYEASYGVKSIIPKIRDTLKYDKLDALISTQEHVNSSVALASAGITSKPMIIFRESNTPGKKGFSGWRRFLYKTFYTKADHYVAVSKGVKHDMIKYYNLEENRVSVIYNPVVNNEMLEASKEEVSHDWFKDDKNVPAIIGMGRIHPQKGFEELIEAFSIVRNSISAKLLIFGSACSPAYMEDLKKKTRNMNLSQDVEFPGFVDNPFKYLSRASLFVLSSKYEGLPAVLIQAMACGCPVVSTDCPSGPEEILENGKYGKLVEVGNAKKLAEAMLETLDTPSDKSKLRQRALAFSFEKPVSQYTELIKSFLQNKQTGIVDSLSVE